MNSLSVDGFLGTRASLTFDIIVVATAAVALVLAWSIWLVRARQRYALHRRVQLGLIAALGGVLLLFELDMRLGGGWRERAAASPYYAVATSADPVSQFLFVRVFGLETTPGLVIRVLAVHLCFAVTTAVLWVTTAVAASRRYDNPPLPNAYSPRHRIFGWLATTDLALTVVTGWTFYWLAFVA